MSLRAAVLLGALCLALAGPSAASATVINVNTTTDELNSDGDCSLREAVQASRLNAAVDACPAGQATLDSISLDASTTYTLSLAGAGDDLNATGDLDSRSGPRGPLTIDGEGDALTSPSTIDAAGLDRVLDFSTEAGTPVSVTVSDTVVTGGLVAGVGGGVRSSSTFISLKIHRTVVALNEASSAGTDGGGVYSEGALEVTSSEITDNQTVDSGGGIRANGGLTMDDSIVSGNTATGEGGGGISLPGTPDSTIVNSEITENQVPGAVPDSGTQGRGGGIYLDDVTATLSLEETLVEDNLAGYTGGGIAVLSGKAIIDGSSIRENQAQVGGGLYVLSGESELDLSDVSSNVVRSSTLTMTGAGIHSSGSATSVERSLVAQNRSELPAGSTRQTIGVGIFAGEGAGSLVLDRSSVIGNTAAVGTPNQQGGGVWLDSVDGDYSMLNSTISGNVLSSTSGRGGGLAVLNATVDVVSSTITDNTADFGEQVYAREGSQVGVRNSVLSDHHASGDDADGHSGCHEVGTGSVDDDGGNLDGGISCGLAAGDSNADPALGALTGGTTAGVDDVSVQLHAPDFGSPAVDRIPAANCTDAAGIPVPLLADQAGRSRPAPLPGSPCDSGSVERRRHVIIEAATSPIGSGGSFDFTASFAGPDASFGLADGAVRAIGVPTQGPWTVTQADPGAAYSATIVVCDDNDSIAAGRSADIKVFVNEIVRCKFTNTLKAVVPPDPDPDPDPDPKDTTAPETSAVAGSKKVKPGKKALFTFSSNEAGSSFMCKVDKAAFEPCASPKKVKTKKLKPGKHKFAVYAIDASGNADATTSRRSFKVG